MAVGARTCTNDRENVLRLLGWLASEGLLATPTLAVFADPQIATAVQRFAEQHVQCGRLYASVAKYVGSCLACARFASATRTPTPEATQGAALAIEQLAALHKQCLQQARQQATFAKKPTAYLEWDGVQRARRAAETALAAYRGRNVAKRQALTRDVVLLTLLTHQPPDRVGVTRLLRLGHTCKRTGASAFELDLSEPGAHKTSAIFGPSRTTIPPPVAVWLARWVELAAVPEGGYLFHVAGDATKPHTEAAWTKLVKATFRRTSGVALAPKDLRSSFVGFLQAGAHSDETLKAAAVAMRHSSQTQRSRAYDKERCNRLTSAAVRVATEYAANFDASA